MIKIVRLRDALNRIAQANAVGEVNDDVLIKACDSYKNKSEDYDDSYEYHVCVTKSLFDHINNLEPDDEVCKAIVPGQTKVVDGVVYIYTATPNAKTKYDWRVLRGVGRKVDDSQTDSKQKFVNELFPTDPASLKVLQKLGGSTGAQLVEDSKGNQYVMKSGSNTSNAHVESEYITNQVYDILGIRVPDFEMYEVNGDKILLSKYIPMTSVPSVSDYPEMAKGFAVDALLANWDIYQNDNCLKDSAGRIIRVDNGGSLSFRAQGGSKPFGSRVSDYDSMMKYNPQVVASLSLQDQVDQINSVLSKQGDLLKFLEESKQDSLKKIFEGRLKDLENIKNNIEAKINKSNRKVLPRNLKSDSDMYATFDDDKLKDFWANTPGNSYDSKLTNVNYTAGWELLDAITKERGFDARPLVVDDKEYWDNVVKNSKYQIFRGLAPGAKDAEYYADDFKYNDNCFWGTIGIHGSGLYFHVNDGVGNKDSDKSNYTKSDAYRAARSYANTSGVIMECALDPKAKVAMVDDLRKRDTCSRTF